VTAIDLAPGMVERVCAEVSARGLAHVDARVGDAEAPDVPTGDVDAVLAGFVLFFIPDPVAALRRYAAALRSGGRLGASWFGADDERWASVFAAVRPYVTPAPDVPRHAAFGSVEALEAALREAGFSSVVTTEEPHVLRFADAAQWYAWSWSHGLRGLWERVPPNRLDEARAAATDAMPATFDETGRPTLRLMLRYTVAYR
jgi:SAM-dependent methyltransferase